MRKFLIDGFLLIKIARQIGYFQVNDAGEYTAIVCSDEEKLRGKRGGRKKEKSAHRGYWSAWSTDCSVFSATARTCRDISSDSCSPCLRIADRRPIASRICFSRRRAPRGAFPRFPWNSVCRTGNVVRARPWSCWTTLWSELRDRTKLPASRRLLLFRQNRATNSVGNHFRPYLRPDLPSLFKTFESGAHANFQSGIRAGKRARSVFLASERPPLPAPPILRRPARFPPTFLSRFLENSARLPTPRTHSYYELRTRQATSGLHRTTARLVLLVRPIFEARKPVSSPPFTEATRSGALPPTPQDSNLIGAPTWLRSKNGAHSPSLCPVPPLLSSPLPTWQSRLLLASLRLSPTFEPSNGLC